MRIDGRRPKDRVEPKQKRGRTRIVLPRFSHTRVM